MKKIIIAAIMASSAILCGCAAQPDGVCATSVSGVCMARWQGGERIPVGEVDIRYAGLVGGAGGEFSGSVETVSVKSWE